MIFAITLIIVVFALYIFYLKLGVVKLLLHPGFYFLIIWAFSIASEWLYYSLGIAIVIDKYYIDELNIYAAYTSICFLLCLLMDKKNRCSLGEIKSFKIFHSYNLFLFLTVLSFIGLVIRFVSMGASFNMGENRANVFLYNMNSTSNFLGSLLGFFNFILLIYSGFLFVSKILKLRTVKFGNFVILLPLIFGVLEGVLIGGRNPVIIAIKYFFIGMSFALLGLKTNKQTLIKLYKFVFVVFVSFAVFSSIVGEQRNQTFGDESRVKKLDNKLLLMTSGISNYLSSHYWGYQLRRIDYVDENNLLYGAATFYGLLDVKVPFSSRLCINDNLNIWNNFTSYTPKELYFDLQYEGYYTTNSIYLSLMKDYGKIGMFFVIFIMVFITHRCFNYVVNYRGRNVSHLFVYLMFFTYWGSSNFDSTMNSNVYMSFLIPLLLYDIIKKFFKPSYPLLISNKN